MTYTSKELAANGVDPRAIEWRKWRRAHRLTLADCRTLTGAGVDAINGWETGRVRDVCASLVGKLEALMRDWHEGMRPMRGRK